MAVIKNVYAAWIKVQPAVPNYNNDGYEWTCDFVMSEKQAKEFRKKYPAKSKSFKEIPNDEFEKKFKMDIPFPDQEDQWVIQLKQSTKRPDGTPNKQPKVLENTGRKNEKGQPILKNITQESAKVGNGSLVSVSVSEFTPKSGPAQGKMTCYLSGIRVDDLVEFVRDNELGEIEESDEDQGMDDFGGEEVEEESTPEVPDFSDEDDDLY